MLDRGIHALLAVLAIGWLSLAASPTLADTQILVFEEAPEGAIELGEVTATSKQFTGRTESGKRSYVIRELQHQAAKLGANALVITQMQRIQTVEPRYGLRRGSMQYEKIYHFVGNGLAIRVSEAHTGPSDGP